MNQTYTLQQFSIAYPQAYSDLPEVFKNNSMEFCDKGEYLLCYNSPNERKIKSLFVLNWDGKRFDDKWKVIYPRPKMQEQNSQSNWTDPMQYLSKTG